MASPTAYKYAGTVVMGNDGKIDWANQNYVKADDTSYASAVHTKFAVTEKLTLTNFGFTSDDIPEGNDITGIEFEIARYSQYTGSDGVSDNYIQVYKSDGNFGSNMGSITVWPNSMGTKSYGGVDNLCGCDGITRAFVLSSDFGLYINTVSSYNGNCSGYIDYIKLRLHYAAAAAGSLPLKNVFNRPFSGVFR